MQNYFIFLLEIIFSCVINSIIVFQHIESRYDKSYNNKVVYIIIKISVSLCMILINLLNIPILNLGSWIMIMGSIVALLYVDDKECILYRIFEIIVLILVLTVCETVGYIALEFIIWKFNINTILPIMLQCLKITFSKVSLVILYYLFIIRIWKSGRVMKITAAQYSIYGLIITYSILNLILILMIVTDKEHLTSNEMRLLLINMFGIVFVDLFFLFFTRFTESNGQLKLRLQLLEQQSKLQYKYYLAQEVKYNESIKILHDVNKHLNMIEEIYKVGEKNTAKLYTKAIQGMLQPLVQQQYTNNSILNILLNDKKRCADLYNIEFTVIVKTIDFSFMEPVEVTTVFGNLLDNAIEACQRVVGSRYINLKLDTYNGFTAINLINSMCDNEKWGRGKTISVKGKNHGIGLINVEKIVKKYNGNMILEKSEGEFSCNIIFSE